MESARTRLNEKIDDFAQEELEHAAEIVFALLKIANEGGDIVSHVDTSPTVSSTQFSSPGLGAHRILSSIRTR